MSNNPEKRKPALCNLYQQYLDSQDSAGFINKVSQSYTPATLQRLAEHPSREIRRGAVLALGFLGDYEVNQTLGRALHDEDRTVRMVAENGIRNIWTRAGNESDRKSLAIIVRLNSAQQFKEAVKQATELIEKSAWFAEAWNQRAIAFFSLGKYVESIRDCHQALEVNPYHFAAAAGMGQAYLQLGNHVSALECFRRALRLNPSLEGVRVQIDRLSRMIEDK
ncbi:MAG: tetratricopeptide repeat protein [Pirellulales bacterium]|nr:tetratricopeptide repeat protein [Pirellulales bacterium]